MPPGTKLPDRIEFIKEKEIKVEEVKEEAKEEDARTESVTNSVGKEAKKEADNIKKEKPVRKKKGKENEA